MIRVSFACAFRGTIQGFGRDELLERGDDKA